ncbi:MAG: transketolase [Smithellaceae bacterium]|nr:transketolase [Smithellaceae bacterium]
MDDSVTFARKIRAHALRMVHAANASHIGSCLSAADVIAVLYSRVLKIDPAVPLDPERDRFILSKGHAAAVLYAALAERGFIPLSHLETYCRDGAVLSGHVTSHGISGVEVSTGSLGHGLPIACGMALCGKREGSSYRVFAMLGDGELDEGSNWEAALFAPQHELDNLVAIVDYNKIQSFGHVKDVIGLEPLFDKWRAFRWAVREVDGHDHMQVERALAGVPFEHGKPSVVIAHTVKGKGISFMEDNLAWHYKSPNAEQLIKALGELEDKK